MSARTHGNNEEIELFPVPVPVHSTDLPTPRPLPGVTPASTAALREALQENNKRFHCFFNDVGFHNHVADTVIALWYLGADSDVIKAAFASHSSYQRPAFNSPGPINKDNWAQHLGDKKYYNAYLAFFVGELTAKDPSAVLEEYVFSGGANFPGGEHKVEMLTRFLDGLLHPLIHTGYGLELGLPGMVVEGLSQTAVHGGVGSPLVPAYWFKNVNKVPKAAATSSLLSILSRVVADSEIIFEKPPKVLNMYQDVVKKHSSKIVAHLDAWAPDLSTKDGLYKTVEEVVFFASLMYGVPGLVSGEEGTFNADFPAMHFVTSSMFLSSILIHLEPRSQELLLRAYVSVCLAWYISRGKPQLNIEAFFADDSSTKSLLDVPVVARPCLPDIPVQPTKPSNPWTSILEGTIVHPDDHISKIQRTFSHIAQVYGSREAGYFKGTELKGAEKIDGTLFVRSANLTAMRLSSAVGKERSQSDRVRWWDTRGFFTQAKVHSS